MKTRIEEIIAYAESRGLKNVLVEEHSGFGQYLFGTGEDIEGWPRVWRICEELGMSFGCGGAGWHQCKIENATLPTEGLNAWHVRRLLG